jgi:hypothetical protein
MTTLAKEPSDMEKKGGKDDQDVRVRFAKSAPGTPDNKHVANVVREALALFSDAQLTTFMAEWESSPTEATVSTPEVAFAGWWIGVESTMCRGRFTKAQEAPLIKALRFGREPHEPVPYSL